MIIEIDNMIKAKAKELNLIIKSNIIYKYSLIYIKIIKGNKTNRKKLKEWIEDNRSLKVNVEVKESNLLKEAAKTITIDNLTRLITIVSVLKGNHMSSIVAVLLLIALAMQDIASAIRSRSKN